MIKKINNKIKTMENISWRKNNSVSKLDKNIISNIFFELGSNNSRLLQLEKFEKKIQENKTSKIFNSINV